MNICPKCKRFYDDEQLRFCLADGSPLVAVGRNETNWEVGESALRVVKQVAKRETAIQWIKQIVWTVITTVIVVSVIYVVVMNTWIYFGGPEKYFPKTVDESTPTPTELPSPTPTPTPERMDLPTPTPTPDKDRRSPTPTPYNKEPRTPTPTPLACNVGKESDEIRRNYASYFFERIKAMQPWLAKQYMTQERQGVLVLVTLNNFQLNISPDCRSASVTHPFQAIIFNRNGKQNAPIDMKKGFSCNKDRRWRCQ